MTDRRTIIHVLEGASQDLNVILAMLSRDESHKGLDIISRRAVGERRYEAWSAVIDFHDTEHAPWMEPIVTVGNGE